MRTLVKNLKNKIAKSLKPNDNLIREEVKKIYTPIKLIFIASTLAIFFLDINHYLLIVFPLAAYIIVWHPKLAKEIFSIHSSPIKIFKKMWRSYVWTVIKIIAIFFLYKVIISTIWENLLELIISPKTLKDVIIYIKQITTLVPWQYIIIVGPIIEEFYFRFIILYMTEFIWGRAMAVIVSIALFSGLHYYSPVYILLIIPNAILWTFFMMKYRSVSLNIIVHAAMNALGIFMVRFL